MNLLVIVDYPTERGIVARGTVLQVSNSYGKLLISAGLVVELPHEKGQFSTERHRKRKMFNYLAQKKAVNCPAGDSNYAR